MPSARAKALLRSSVQLRAPSACSIASPISGWSRAIRSVSGQDRIVPTACGTGNLVSDMRLKKFLDAEVTHFAHMPHDNLTLSTLLRDAASPLQTALRVYHEIPKHFAQRILRIEEIKNWEEDENLKDLHSRYWTSFQEMRMASVDGNLADFTTTVRQLKVRQKEVLPLLRKTIQQNRSLSSGGKDEHFWNTWLDHFLRSRVSTEMLTSQYLAIINQVDKGQDVLTGIVDPACNPAAICERAVMAAKHLAFTHENFTPKVEVEVRSKISTSFSYIPIYLHYILLEVLKNSCMAMARRTTSGADDGENPLQVVISSDDQRVAVRISDQGGGIPFEVGDRVWKFNYSGWSEGNPNSEATNLSGFGLGLPLARLYAQYLGGNLSLVSLPEYGVDTYLLLPRIDTNALSVHGS
eukprot:TRINITY_DN36328_c0_g1_i1.p1 TRINITY_DN36328_c0_g1~~TRINITY_DN36328_c0_g1_i1.p1  ORF type:complete len:409 (-),score=39.14 TRINITY_DN36328_c0_g1_i1:68-1294(-)